MKDHWLKYLCLCFYIELVFCPFAWANSIEAEPIVIQLMAAEQARDWGKAKQFLNEMPQQKNRTLKQKLAGHGAKLYQVTTDLVIAADYHQQGNTQSAHDVLATTLKMVRKDYEYYDLPLLTVVLETMGKYQSELYRGKKRSLDQQYLRVVDLANNYKFDAAIDLLNTLRNMPGLDAQTLFEYEEKLTQLHKSKLAYDHPVFWERISKTIVGSVEQALVPLISVLLLYLLYVLYRSIYRPFRADFTEIALEDQSEASAEQTEMNNILSQVFDQTLKRIVREINEDGELDGLVNLDGSGLINMSAGRWNAPGITKYMDSNPIQIGVLKLTPKSVFDILNYVFRTRGSATVTGALLKEDNGDYVLRIEKRSVVNKVGTTGLVIDGRAKTRDGAINQAAMQLVVNESKLASIATKDWRSLEALLNAKRVLDNQIDFSLSVANSVSQGDPEAGVQLNSIVDYLNEAKVLLQKSLLIDPSNWIARFRLANVLRKIGENRTAHWQYSYVMDLICNKDYKQNVNLVTYVKQQPLFPFQVLYNKTICMARMGSAYMKSNSQLRRHRGFEFVAMALGDLQLYAGNLIELCDNNDIRVPLESIIKKIDAIKLYYGGQRQLIEPIKHTKTQLQMLKNSIYEKLSHKQITSGGKTNKDSEKTSAQKLTIQAEKKSVNDMIYQIYSGVISVLTSLYEYHIDFGEVADDRVVGELFDLIIDLEKWFFTMRMELDNKNRNAYAYSHAIAHNSVGRVNYLRVREIIDRKEFNTDADMLKHYFDDSECFLRWAIAYHLPASFADPYVNLASLYLKALDTDSLQKFLPGEWKTKTEAYLLQALRLSPSHQKANYQLGRLYQSRVFEDRLLPDSQSGNSYFNRALYQYSNAGEDSYSYYRAAELYADRGQYNEALVKIKLCTRIYHRYDQPHQLYLEIQTKVLAENCDRLMLDFDESLESACRQNLEEALELCAEITANCLQGEKAVRSECCSSKLDKHKILKSMSLLTQLKTRLDSLNEKVGEPMI